MMVCDPAEGNGAAGGGSGRKHSLSGRKRSYITSRHTEMTGSNDSSLRAQNGVAPNARPEDFC